MAKFLPQETKGMPEPTPWRHLKPSPIVQEARFRIAGVTAPDPHQAMKKARRTAKWINDGCSARDVAPWTCLATVDNGHVDAGCGGRIAVLLHQLPQQVDIMMLLSTAIDDLIGGVQQLLEAMLGLGAIVLIAAISLVAAVLLLGALWRLIRIMLVVSPNQGRR